jgi:MSHA biogenesis protein MshQ
LPGYDGTPSINNTLVTGTPTAGAVGGSFSVAPVGSGVATGSSFFYSEVGNFGLGANAVFDSGFTSVDPSGTDCTNDFSNALVGGRYGCLIGSAAVPQSTGVSGFGRFIPDNFNVTYNVPVIAPACGGFSYVGQTFNYTTAPVMTITARNGTNNGLTNATTVNYAGSYAKFTNAQLAQTPYDTNAGRYLRFDTLGGGNTPDLDRTGLPDPVTADPVIGTFTAGVGAFTFSGGGGFGFTRSTTTPSAQFDADIVLRLNVVDTDNVVFAGNPASFGAASAGGGILFSDGNALTTADKSIRYGRLRIGGASGSQVLPLRLPVEAQYWSGTAFVTNTLDACTTLVAGNVGLGNYGGSLNAGETTASIVNSPLQAGRSAIQLSAPGAGNSGSVDVTLNLGGVANADACSAFAPAATAGNKSYLRGLWCNPPNTYSKDPSAKARFGVMRGADQSIYRREQ